MHRTRFSRFCLAPVSSYLKKFQLVKLSLISGSVMGRDYYESFRHRSGSHKRHTHFPPKETEEQRQARLDEAA